MTISARTHAGDDGDDDYEDVCSHRSLSSSFLGDYLNYRILNLNQKTELLRVLWVGASGSEGGCGREKKDCAQQQLKGEGFTSTLEQGARQQLKTVTERMRDIRRSRNKRDEVLTKFP